MAYSIGQFVVLLGLVTLLLALYAMIVRSAGIFPTQRHFWRTTLISAGISYALSGILFWLFHTPIVGVFIVSALVTFIVGNFDGSEHEKPDGEPENADEASEEEALEKDGNATADTPVS